VTTLDVASTVVHHDINEFLLASNCIEHLYGLAAPMGSNGRSLDTLTNTINAAFGRSVNAQAVVISAARGTWVPGQTSASCC